jgi:hypothetical protein
MTYAKAIVAALTAGLGTLSSALADGTITPGEWVAIVVTTLAGAGLTAWIPNKTAPAAPAGDQTVQPYH